MRSMMSRPRALSLRNPEAVIEPSGNAMAAATESRSGSCGPIASRCFGVSIMSVKSRLAKALTVIESYASDILVSLTVQSVRLSRIFEG